MLLSAKKSVKTLKEKFERKKLFFRFKNIPLYKRINNPDFRLYKV
jgi:hypothetical protein